MREAVAAYDAARASDPGPAPEWATLTAADAWLYLREPEKALALYEDGIRELQRQQRDRYPDNYELLLGKYFTLCDLERFDEAGKVLDRLDAEIPIHVVGNGILAPSYHKFDTMIERGWLLAYTRSYGAAERHFSSLLDQAPGNSNLRTAIGYMHYFREWPRLALEDFQIAAATDPQDIVAQVGRAYTLNENDRWREARTLADELSAQAPRHTLVRELDRDLGLQLRPYFEAEYECGLGAGLMDTSRLTLRLTMPVQPFRNVYTEAVWLRVKDDNGTKNVFRDRVGVDWRLARDLSVRAAIGIDSYRDAASFSFGATYAPCDHWTFTADLDSDTLDLPPGAYSAGVQGWLAAFTAKYRLDERTAFTAGYDHLRLDDGNRVQTFTGLLEQTVWANARWQAGINLDAYHTIASRSDVAYYSPQYYGACYAVPNLEHVWFRRYETSLTDRISLGIGPHWEDAHGTMLVWYVRYEAEWVLSKRFSLLGGVTWSQNRYGNEHPDGLSLNLALKYIF
jgi:biofilm PGA synthesis protein PgaA